MSRIVLTPIGSFGDLHPKIAIAKRCCCDSEALASLRASAQIALELRKRGHDVVFATHKEYQEKIEALGFEFHRMRPDNNALSACDAIEKQLQAT